MWCVYKINSLALLLVSAVNVSLMCNTFGNLEVEITPKIGKRFKTQILGCVEPSRFSDNPDLQVEQVKFSEQPIPKLKKGTVQNLAKLKYIEFDNTSTEIIEPEAFRHLPRLIGIFLTHSRVKLVQNNTFQNLPSLVKVRLHHNDIGLIQDYAFAEIPTLKYVTIGNNKIEQWNTKWFINSTAIEELDFQKNLLSKIPANAFPGLKNILRIVLDYNKIAEIESGAFDDIEHLKFLGIKYNCLKVLPADIFPIGIRIDFLYIDSNLFNFLANEVLERISLKGIALSGNPWKCPCLQRTLFWFHQKQRKIKLCSGCTPDQSLKPMCIYPNTFATTCLEITDDEATKTYFKLTNNLDIVSKCSIAN